MTKQPFMFSLNPTTIAMLDRVLANHDRAVLTRNQIAEVAPMRQMVREARAKINLMARSEIISSVGDFDVYPHPDHRADGSLMIYDRVRQGLHVMTPFKQVPDEDEILAWINAPIHV